MYRRFKLKIKKKNKFVKNFLVLEGEKFRREGKIQCVAKSTRSLSGIREWMGGSIKRRQVRG